MPELVSPTPPLSRRDRLVTFGLWLLVLAPLLMAARLVYLYSVDQRFLDDWVWATDLVKWKEGKYGELFHDLCAVHLEHRPIVPRVLALIVTLALRGNVQGQNVLSFLWITITFAMLGVLWMKRGGMTLRQGWLPLFIASAVIFSPIQWQAFLWPICHETPLPVMFFLLSLLAAFKPWHWWWRSLFGTLCAILAMLSFASGFLIWVLPLPVFLLSGAFAANRERARFVIVWALVFCVTMLAYLKVNVQRHDSITVEKKLVALPGGYDLTYDLHNEVASAYSYGHSEENTMNGEFEYFAAHPALDSEFVATFCGAFPARGWSADLKTSAQTVGWVLIMGLLWATVYFFRHWRDPFLRASLLPMLCLGAYTPMTGLMVAVGRISAGGTGSALNGRYNVHQGALVIALIGAAVFIARHRREKNTAAASSSAAASESDLPPWGWALAGVLVGALGIGWIHGASMMWEWNAARWRGAAAQYLSQELKRPNVFVGFVAGNYNIAKNSAKELNDVGLLRHGLAKDRRLSNFTIAAKSPELEDDQGEFQRLWKNEASEWRVQGYALLPGVYRPADAVLLAYRAADGNWVMFGFTQCWGAPYYLSRSLSKDEYAIIPGRDPWPERIMCPIFPEVYIEEEPPPGAQITAWALDMKLRLVHRIAHWRDLPGPKGKLVNTPDGRDGSTMKELARDDIDP